MLEVGVVDEEYFLAMEFLDGQPLHRLERRAAKQGRGISRDVQLALLADVLSGLHHAHELKDYDGSPLNVVHRDVTPQNIFITYDGVVKVMDFGIAKAAGRAQETMHGVVKGKVRYMSPEQAMGMPLDRRADVFAVGIMLWQAATGQRFWSAPDDLSIVQALVHGQYQASPRAVAPECPEELDRIVQKSLAREANDRYRSALELRADLEAFLGPAAFNGHRELSTLVNELFAKERRELRAVIEKVGRESAQVQQASIARLAMQAPSSTSIGAFAQSLRPATPSGETDAKRFTVDSAPPSTSVGLVSRRTSRKLEARIVGGAIAVAALALGGFAFTQLGARETVQRSEPAALVSSRIPIATRANGRYEPPPPPPAEDELPAPAVSPAHVAPSAATHSAPPPAGSAPAPTPSAQPVVAAARPSATGTASARGGHRRLTLDAADPWANHQ
jgi:serine/threonine-protein kinase